MGRSRGSSFVSCPNGYPPNCDCSTCSKGGSSRNTSRRRGTFNSTSFRDRPQRNDGSVTNTFFNSGKEDGSAHGHVKYRDNPDGTTDYLYARDVEGNEYDV